MSERKTIELTREVKAMDEVVKTIKVKLIFFGLKLVFILALAWGLAEAFTVLKAWSAMQYAVVKNWAISRITKVEIVREYVKPLELSTENLITSISKEYGINPILTLAVIHQESGRRLRTDRLKFEPKLYGKWKGTSDEETRMLATSIGLMQVIPGFHAKSCNLQSYSDLFDTETNIRCGLKVLTDCLKYNQKAGSKLGQYRAALQCYNGSSVYADEVLSRLGELVLENNIL